MKETPHAENVSPPAYAFIDDTTTEPIAIRESRSLAPVDEPRSGTALDGLVTAVKLIFLFVPGAAAIHMIMLGFALMLFYEILDPAMMAGTLGVMIVSTFMIMLGIGKLTDLRYLRVVAGVSAAGAIASVVYAILASLVPGDFFGSFALFTLPLTLLAAYLVKRYTDRLPDTV